MNKNLVETKLLRGFRDILPSMALSKEEILNKLRKVFRSYGFVPIETPHLEYAEILVGKAGDEIQKELYRFKDNGNRDVALRFDQTVPLARFVVQNKNQITFPFKRYAIGNVFRGEKSQSGRYREFTQCDFDYIGTNSLNSDIEIIQVINSALKALEINDFIIYINNRKIMNGFVEYLKIEDKIEGVLRNIDKIEKIGKEKVIENLKNDLALTDDIINEIIKFVSFKQNDNLETFFKSIDSYKSYNETMKKGIEDLEYIFYILNSIGNIAEKVKIDFSIARGLSYYTGIVYETILTKIPKIGSICSGGRFDELTKNFSKEELVGVGASIGIDRLITALQELSLIKEKNTSAKVLIINIDRKYIINIYQLAKKLRIDNINVEVYPDTTKIKKQFNYANKKNHEYIIILAENEIKEEKISLKNLNSGTQELLLYKDLVEVLRIN